MNFGSSFSPFKREASYGLASMVKLLHSKAHSRSTRSANIHSNSSWTDSNPKRTSRQRVADSVETALREGRNRLRVLSNAERTLTELGRERACARCAISLPEPSPQHFSFNSPLGMCPDCNGLGQRLEIDAELLIPDAALSIRQGALVPFAAVMVRGSGINFGLFEALSREFRPRSQATLVRSVEETSRACALRNGRQASRS